MSKRVKPLDEKLTLKQKAWLKYFLDKNDSSTFFNRTGAARKAYPGPKYKHTHETIGSQNYRKLQKRIVKWLDEVGLDEATIKKSFVDSLSARSLLTFHIRGKEVKRLHPAAQIVGETEEGVWIVLPAPDNYVRLRATELTAKLRNLFPVEKKEMAFSAGNDKVKFTVEIVDDD